MDLKIAFPQPVAAQNLFNIFSLRKGSLTFEAEGSDRPGRFYSRVLHWPGAASGVTIGRGYDMKHRSLVSVTNDLIVAGLSRHDAGLYARGAGLTGNAAASFVARHRDAFPELSAEVEENLFDLVTYPEAENDVRRILNKSDLVARYGKTNWNTLPTEVQELLVDLRYRGDYTPTTRRTLQPLITRGDWQGLKELMNNKSYWRALGVPTDRINRRASFSEGL